MPTTFLSKKNNALSKVATVGGIDNTTDPVTFAVTTGEGSKFPAANFNVSIDNEILLCTSRTGDNLTCDRAKESTTIAAHSQNADVENRITAGALVEHETAINAGRKSIIHGSNVGTTIAAGETKYVALGVGASVSIPSIWFPVGGTIKTLFVYGYNPAGSAQTLVATVMIAGSATALTGTINTGSNQISDVIHSARVEAGEYLSLRVVLSASAATLTFLVFSVEFDAD